MSGYLSISEQLRLAEERQKIESATVQDTVQESVEEPVEEPMVQESVEEPVMQESMVQESVEEPMVQESVEQNVVPKLVFIVPYRDREQQQNFFKNHMKTILEDLSPNDYKIYYIHQVDTRSFNRGAMKNIGYLMVKEKYPNDYKDITLVFNDVDTMPFTKNFLNYYTTTGVIKHFYGVRFALGGIVSITAGDFEKLRGFPNNWAWGFEDNQLYNRAVKSGILVDRSQFYPLMDKNIFQMKDGLQRVVNRTEFDRYLVDDADGYTMLKNVQYNIDESTGFVNVTSFVTGKEENVEKNTLYDLRSGNPPFHVNTTNTSPQFLLPARRTRPTMSMMF